MLIVYELKNRTVVYRQKLFPSCFKITSIKVVGESVIVSSETSLKLLSKETYEELYDFSKLSLDKIVAYDYQCPLLYTVNAHNFIEVWDLALQQRLSRQFCVEECLLYSADINLRTMMIAAGTVFRTILIWKLDFQS